MQSLMMIVLMIVVFYFLLIRPQQKRQRDQLALLAKLGTDDVVITRGGVIGRIASVSGDVLVLELLDQTQLCVPRSYVEGKYTGELPELPIDAAAVAA